MSARATTGYQALAALLAAQAGFALAAFSTSTWVSGVLATGLACLVLAAVWSRSRHRSFAFAWPVIGAVGAVVPYPAPLGWPARAGLALGVVGLLSAVELAHLVHRTREPAEEGEARAHRAQRGRLWRVLGTTGVLLGLVLSVPLLPVPGLQPWIASSVEWAGAPGILLAGAIVALAVLSVARVRRWAALARSRSG